MEDVKTGLPRLMEVREVAQYLGKSEWMVYDLIRRGDLPAVRIGRCVRVSEKRLAEWIEAGGTVSREG